MTFASILTEWASTYRPMMHNPEIGNKRLFFINGPQGVVDFTKDVEDKLSPCVLFDFTVEGEIKEGRVDRFYPVYFMVKAQPLNGTASGMADGEAAAVALEWAWTHAQAFLAWIGKKIHDNQFDQNYSMIDLDEFTPFNTAGPLQNGWWGVLIQFTRNESRWLCPNEADYIVPCCDGEEE